MTSLARWLEERGAYRDVVAWAEAFGDDWSAAWQACPRGDWLLAIAATLETTERSALVRAACGCAELALEVVDDATARDGIARARAWCEGALADDAVALAVSSLERALADEPAVQSAQAAALATLAAILDPREAPGAAASAVHANALATGECALESVVRYAHATTADRVRSVLSAPAPPHARG